MSDHLPKEVRDGLRSVRRSTSSKRRMTVKVGGQSFTILRHWNGGFALDEADAPKMRGLVDVYDGPKFVSRCLVVASDDDAPGERNFEYKRETRATDGPALDYERDLSVPLRITGPY